MTEPKLEQILIDFSEEPQTGFRGDTDPSKELTERGLVSFGNVLEAFSRSLKTQIQSESTLTIELAGEFRIEKETSGEGGFTGILKLGLGAAKEKATTVKVILETQIKPGE